MSDCTTVFETLKELLPIGSIVNYVEKTNADHGTKKFTVTRHLTTLMYANLTEKNSLRAITDGIFAEQKLQKYTGTISASQLSRKNSDRNPDIFKTMFQYTQMIMNKHALKGRIPNTWGDLKALDSTIVRLTVSLFPWAYYRSNTAAVKIHTLFDIINDCPENIILTEGIIHDKDKLTSFVKKPGTTYIFDRGYMDYKEFDRYCHEGTFFISRLKKNSVFKTINVNGVAEESNVISDKEVILGGPNTKMQHSLRIVEVLDSNTNEPFYIVTNRFDLTAEEISQIYRLRWQIELFFKWIKQHLKIKKFYGTSYNAILNQIYSALILYCLLKLMHMKLGVKNQDFLRTVRLIAGGLFNSFQYLQNILTSSKPPGKKRLSLNWKNEYRELLKIYNLKDNINL